jgi:hypothetical protein
MVVAIFQLNSKRQAAQQQQQQTVYLTPPPASKPFIRWDFFQTRRGQS